MQKEYGSGIESFDRQGALADVRKRGRILAAALKVRIAQVAIRVGRVS